MSTRTILSGFLGLLLIVPAAFAVPCALPDNGAGTIDLPPECPEGYVGPMQIVDGFPPGTTIDVDARLGDFTDVLRWEGGLLDGEIQQCAATLLMEMTGTGVLAGYQRTLPVPVTVEFHTAVRVPGDSIQSFDALVFAMYGEVIGDPDFDLLEIYTGEHFSLPSPGMTTLTELPSGDYNIDSFFDVTYRIEFVGAPGGPLDGFSGSTTGADHFHMGEPLTPTGLAAGVPAAAVGIRARPNPFNPATTIAYTAPVGNDELSVRIYDTAGRLVRTLVAGGSGTGTVVWDGRSDGGNDAPSGVYFSVLRTDHWRAAEKLVLIR